MRTASNVYNLRSQRSFNCVRGALKHGADRFGVRIVHFSVQGNHMHFIVEADDVASLYRAMKGLAVRFARRMNTMMGRKGRVLGDRYHSNVLRTWRAAHNAVAYVRHNHRKHMAQVGQIIAATWIDPFSSFAGHVPLPAPRTRPLTVPP
jgi:REP element-mobilizing transposase RayT